MLNIPSRRIAFAALLVISICGGATAQTVNWGSGVSYIYDASGNIRQIGGDAFVYDHAGRLVQADQSGVRRNYTYDAFGNRMQCLQAAGTPQQADCQWDQTVNTLANKNRLNVPYDDAGNLTSLAGHQYSYDALNMMTRDSFGVTREFVYTADDERIAVHTAGSSWLWTIRAASGQVLREFASQDGPAGISSTSWVWLKDYVWRNGLLLASRQSTGSAASTFHYHLDHLGTPRQITDQDDRIVGIHDYFAFGPEKNGSRNEQPLNALKYTAHERDASSSDFDGLDYLHARYYSPAMGRFLSADLARAGIPTTPQTWNRYAYTAGNPVKFVDRNGEWLELASTNDRQFYVAAIAHGTANKAARELFLKLANDPLRKIELATGNLPFGGQNSQAATFQYGDSSRMHGPYRQYNGDVLPSGITTTVDKMKLSMVSYPTPTISVFHEFRHDDTILYQGVAANGNQPDNTSINLTTGQVTVNSVFEAFGRDAEYNRDDPMHALSEADVNKLIGDPGAGPPKPPCQNILCIR